MSNQPPNPFHNTRPCSGCFYIFSKDYYTLEEWDGEINKIRYCKSCKKHGNKRGSARLVDTTNN